MAVWTVDRVSRNGTHPSFRTIAQFFIRFFWLVLVFVRCCFAHCHTRSSALRCAKFISSHMVLVMLPCVVLWLGVSGLGRSCCSGSVESGIGGRVWCRRSVFIRMACMYVIGSVSSFLVFSCSDVCFRLRRKICRIVFWMCCGFSARRHMLHVQRCSHALYVKIPRTHVVFLPGPLCVPLVFFSRVLLVRLLSSRSIFPWWQL